MYEDFLEDIAQRNALREVNPYCKLAAGLGAIVLSLLSASYIPPLFIALVMTAALILLARIDVRTYAALFGIPFLFAGLSVAVIVLITGGREVFWSWNIVSGLTLSITRESINEGFFVFCRFLGGMSALCFISLTTPMTDLFVVMRQCRIPVVLIELSMIIYRTIFILLHQLMQIYQAQIMRMGYSSLRESIHSFATLCGAVFIASWTAGEDLIQAMDARCYRGKFAILGETQPVDRTSLLVVGGFLAGTLVIVVLSGTIPII